MLSDSIRNAHKKLNLRDVPIDVKEQITELSVLAQKYFDANTKKKQVDKVLKAQKAGILLRVEVGETVDLSDVQLTVKVSTRDTIDMDEPKLEYLLTKAIEANPELKDVMTVETITKKVIHEDILNGYLQKGLLEEKEIMSCITVKKAKMVTIKKMKTGGKK